VEEIAFGLGADRPCCIAQRCREVLRIHSVKQRRTGLRRRAAELNRLIEPKSPLRCVAPVLCRRIVRSAPIRTCIDPCPSVRPSKNRVGSKMGTAVVAGVVGNRARQAVEINTKAAHGIAPQRTRIVQPPYSESMNSRAAPCVRP